MADLIIQGLHLPKSLGGEETHIGIRVFSDGTAIMATSRPPYYKKFEAVPLPEGHGRLGDLDALQEEFKKYHNGKRLMLIDTALTIVPAEGSVNDGT